jgi:hypothetical protein
VVRFPSSFSHRLSRFRAAGQATLRNGCDAKNAFRIFQITTRRWWAARPRPRICGVFLNRCRRDAVIEMLRGRERDWGQEIRWAAEQEETLATAHSSLFSPVGNRALPKGRCLGFRE